MITLKHFVFALKSLFLTLTILKVATVGKYIYDNYIFYTITTHNLAKVTFQYVEQHEGLIFTQLLTMLSFFLIQFISLIFISKIINALIIPSFIIKQWFDTIQISTILGRYLTTHYRTHKYISIYDFLKIINTSKNEMKNIKYHSNNTNLAPLFQEFDKHYSIDKDNIK
jgi:hypothetical protein